MSSTRNPEVRLGRTDHCPSPPPPNEPIGTGQAGELLCHGGFPLGTGASRNHPPTSIFNWETSPEIPSAGISGAALDCTATI